MPRVDNKGVSILYRVEGNGPPLVLLHGFTDSGETWYERGYVAALQPKYRLVVIDARGHGQSDKPHDPQSYTPENLASDIIAVLDDLGIKSAAYWGYSRGGWTGFALARHALDRVACFVIGGASASTALPFAAAPGKEDPLITAFRGGPDAIINKHWGEEWMTPPLRKRLLASDTAALIACQQQRLISEGFSDVVGKITVPTLIYAGSADPIYNPARQTASEILGAQFISLPDLNHLAGLCRSDLVLPHVEPFLAKALH
jgi:pimeloyl-ACP methyl ester carboxylesterase